MSQQNAGSQDAEQMVLGATAVLGRWEEFEVVSLRANDILSFCIGWHFLVVNSRVWRVGWFLRGSPKTPEETGLNLPTLTPSATFR